MKQDSGERPVRVGMISLGCAKNLVDAEVMVGTLLKDGVEITSDAAQADVVIVNTCSFIDSAQEESVDTILESAELRDAKNRGQGLIVAGCLPQRFREQLPALLPEVDAFMGIDQVTQVTDIVRQALAGGRDRVRASRKVQSPKSKVRGPARGSRLDARPLTVLRPRPPLRPLLSVSPRPRYVPDYATPRFRLTPRHFAYVKIAEGCNHPCSFCIIPRMRGSHRSRAQADIVAEAKALLADGVKELNLISQDSTYYGLDLRPVRSGAIASPEQVQRRREALPAQATTMCTLAARVECLAGRVLDSAALHPPGALDGRADPNHRRVPESRALRGHPLAAHPPEHAGADAARNLPPIHRGPDPPHSRRRSRHRLAHHVHRGVSRRDGSLFRGLAGLHSRDAIRAAGRVHLFAGRGHARGRDGRPDPGQDQAAAPRPGDGGATRSGSAGCRGICGPQLKVLVEQPASAAELQARPRQLVGTRPDPREDQHTAPLKGRLLVARGEADAPDIDGRVYMRGQLPLGEFARVRVIGHTDYDLIAVPV